MSDIITEAFNAGLELLQNTIGMIRKPGHPLGHSDSQRLNFDLTYLFDDNSVAQLDTLLVFDRYIK